MTTMKDRLVAGYEGIIDNPDSTPSDKLAALNALRELTSVTVTTVNGEQVTPTEAAQGDPPPAERFGHDAPDPTSGVPPVVLGGQVSGPVATDAPVVPQPATAAERAAIRKGRRTLA